MSQIYVAAYDGSTASVAALTTAVQLAADRQASVVAVHAYPMVIRAGLRGGLGDDELQVELRDAGKATLDGLEVEGVDRRILRGGSPAKVLHDVAVEERASLIVVGATHHHGIGRFVPGSVAANLLHGAPCPVLVVPAEGSHTPIDRVVVAYDEGEQSQAALHRAVEIARDSGARLRIVAAFEPRVTAGPEMIAGDLDGSMREELRARLRGVAAAIEGVEVETVVRTGRPAEVVIEAAGDADLIVTGSRGYGPLHSVIVGGTSRRLVDRAPCAVLVVPRVPAPVTETVLETGASPRPA
jgi:nucleotide-binding universal stress UspA family protein